MSSSVVTHRPPGSVFALAQTHKSVLCLYDLADRDFEAALRQQPGNAPAYIGLGLLAQKSGDLATAIEDYAHALHSQPTALGYLLLAQSLESSGQMERANAAHSQALQLTPDIRRDIAMMNQLLAN